MFIVSINYTVPLDQIDARRQEHIAYLDEHYAKGVFLASGRKHPRTGFILAKLPTRAELDAVLDRDPFRRERLATYEVIEVVPTKVATGLEHLLEASP